MSDSIAVNMGAGGAGLSVSDERVLQAAVHWQVRLESGAATDKDRLAFERWCAADARHQAAWRRVAGLLDSPLSVVRELGNRAPEQIHAAQHALLHTRRRNLLRGALAVAGVGSATALIADRLAPLGQVTADLRTGTGERRHFALSDGSDVELNARSAADVRFDDAARVLRLRAGALIATVARDVARPFSVQTTHGEARALGTRFLTQLRDTHTQVVVLEHQVEIATRSGQRITLQAGEGATFTTESINRMGGAVQSAAAWSGGMLAVDDAPLSEVIEDVRAYHRGFIRVSLAAAPLRVFGVFPLGDTEQILQALAHSLPLNVQRVGGWVISIDVRQA
ncbi:FecR family protein [Pigmentiphaga aceris]|uniref:FecR family protein n=1 Tax=Pigmentiphaga aceris TaxID=1940612 RepID=A0A5C0AX97_9BURK|nr:FecR family protein [Pigmentiphaga aceris]QEI04977.1 FecR family protein [Pigmentiphaga aceris]